MTAQPMTAACAHGLGFLNRLVPPGAARSEALSLASIIAANSPAVVQAIKQGRRIARESSPAEFSDFEAKAAARLMMGQDAREGVAAFQEKRKPRF